ncbi:hypothetical protein HanXRQr2_Chr01g0019941 [Helianthus annuus]|uniref:Uncharacterized protein n=1 Tax=Helianthus annuus TaxID=4232 RepID=A0A9K3JWD1_HELAN|nr:hypothetical protein HanXRQr2_Chr01g0019941 [Helianthus annuus]
MDAIFRRLGGMSQTADFALLGIHSTKRRVLVLHIDHLFVHFLCAHFTTEHGCDSEVAPVSGWKGPTSTFEVFIEARFLGNNKKHYTHK